MSIIIPCLNHAAELSYCLRGLQAQESDLAFEVIVVDSGPDPAAQAVAEEFSRVQLLRAQERLSPGAARNLGAKHALSDLLGFIDADCIPQPGWVQTAVATLRAGAVLASGAVMDASPWNFIASSDNRLQFADFPPRRPPGVHAYFPATALAVQRVVFESAGTFDESQMIAQDVLLTTKIAHAWPDRSLFQPQMLVWHMGRARWHDFLEHQRRFGFSRSENRLRMDRSYVWLGEHPTLAWIVVLRRLLYISARVVQWNLPDLPRLLLQLPILLVGLAAWAEGFYAGMEGKPAATIQQDASHLRPSS